MIVIGIDPGIAICGYGVLYEKDRIEVIDYGVIETGSDLSKPKRLKKVYESYIELLEKYNPDAVAVEELFFNKNAKTAISVGEARGVALLAAALKGVEIYEYTPLQIKQMVVGYGWAKKNQIQEMTRVLLNLKELPKPDDAADALAVALCHLYCKNIEKIYGV
ncbi:crossover junction endodeoxyribonuclease RuvC [Thermovenabulum gondwanense]|uniref:Crossover junction endodeoxyribonuclease RuvC n=1 Tax=Thermovenabulum gondwanense TaxID=520767 RepID=A0A162M4X9_9FIRM|nr:crossover junction endodeoxyribonuclease RuvC [Thermovenabulum gondwanense]KYO63981.1 Crossover junction endodeoxyribonuclease RuvC [Thermovenabulum gondwanense]